MQVFLSYSRKNQAEAEILAADVQKLGYSVWLDQALTGGQAWWDQILSKVRKCDVFIFVLSPESLDSMACKREWRYASQLNKRILPVLVTEVSQNLIPTELSKIQFVDYRQSQDKRVVFALNTAIQNLPPPRPLPDPLPEEPEVPISYLSNIKDEIESSLSPVFAEQIALVYKLKDHLIIEDEYEDTRQLLLKLKGHENLLAKVADEIDEILLNAPPRSMDSTKTSKISEPTPHPPPAAQVSSGGQRSYSQPKKSTSPNRIIRAVVVLGFISIILLVGVVISLGGLAILINNSSPTDSSIHLQPIDSPQPTISLKPTLVNLPESFYGVTGKARLDWQVTGIYYTANIETTGLTGMASVTYNDPSTGAALYVTQDLNLQQYQGVWFYVGSNPRDTFTGATDSVHYSPDIFRLTPTSTGQWTIDAVCDLLYQCGLVTTTPLR
jgi:hypothetical protein